MRGINGVHEIVACLIHHGLDISTREETEQIIFEIMVQKSLPRSQFSISTNKQSLATYSHGRRMMHAPFRIHWGSRTWSISWCIGAMAAADSIRDGFFVEMESGLCYTHPILSSQNASLPFYYASISLHFLFTHFSFTLLSPHVLLISDSL
jgi:hypothetical protein